MAKVIPPASSSDLYTWEDLELIRDQPHLLGHLCGYTKLTQLHSKWIKYIWCERKKHKHLMAARGCYKSTSIVEVGCIYEMLFNPDTRICIARKDFTSATEVLGNIVRLLQRPEIQELFRFAHGEPLRFLTKRNDKILLSCKSTTTKEGSIEAKGMNSSWQGYHYDRVILDDTINQDDKLSKAEREKTKDITRDIMSSIIDPDKPCNVIGTKWHKDDAWVILDEEKIPHYNIYDCNLFTEEQIEQKRKDTSPTLFSINYMLKVIPSESAPFADIQWDDEFSRSGCEKTMAHIDCAYGAEGDYTALTIAHKMHDGRIQVVGYAAQMAVADMLNMIAEKCRLYKVRKIYVEKQGDRGWAASMLRSAGMSVCEYDESMNKIHKISDYISEVFPRIRFCKESDNDYVSMIQDWMPEAKNFDDAPDSLASLIRACFTAKGTRANRYDW